MKKFFALFVMAMLAAAPAMANEAVKSATTPSAPSSHEAMKASETTTKSAAPATASAPSTTSTTSTSTKTESAKTETPASSSSTTSTASSKSSTTSTTTASSSETLPSGLKSLNGSKGQYFATASGMTLYTFAKDEAGKSNCTGACSKMWPALAASSTDKAIGQFSIINGNQWAFNGKPLYTYVMDKKSGDMNGSSIPGWSIASSAPSAPAEKPAH